MTSPKCIGIILDGNRRFARANDLPLLEGHRRGFEKVKEVVGWAKDEGISHLILFVFSTENWQRSKKEVSYLMSLLARVLVMEVEHLKKKGVRVLCLGERKRFSPKLQKLMKEAEERTAENKRLTLALCLSYGGHAEILHAVNRALASGEKQMTEEQFANHLYTAGLPDPDMIVRTSGEMRLSGFLPWQGIYSELFFTKTLWPDFSRDEFRAMLTEYAARDRRHGR